MRTKFIILSICVFILFSLISTLSYAQEKLSYPIVKSKIEAAYAQGNWNEIISVGKEAKKQNIEFFQLHYILGVAYFEEGQYFLSIHQLEKAKKQNFLVVSDSIFMTYLYYAYVHTMQYGLAEDNRLLSGLKNLKKRCKAIKSIGVNRGIMMPTIQADTLVIQQSVPNGPFPGIPKPYYREMNYPEKQEYTSLTLESDLGSKLMLWLNYSRIVAHRYNYLAGPRDQILESYTVNQNQLYSGLQYQINPYWNFYLGGNYFTYQSYKLEFDDFDDLQMLQTKTESSYHKNYLFSTALFRQYKNMKFGAKATYSEINTSTSFQGGLSFVYFPFHSVDYYTVSNLVLKRTDALSQFIFHQQIGFKVAEDSWFELEGRIGNLTNFADMGGSNVYNITDELRMMGAIQFKQMVFKKLLFTGSFGVCSKTNIYGDITNPGEDIVSKENNYKQYNIIGGLKWIF